MEGKRAPHPFHPSSYRYRYIVCGRPTWVVGNEQSPPPRPFIIFFSIYRESDDLTGHTRNKFALEYSVLVFELESTHLHRCYRASSHKRTEHALATRSMARIAIILLLSGTLTEVKDVYCLQDYQ